MHINFLLHKKSLQKRSQKKDESQGLKKIIDKLVYLSAFISVFANVPQLAKIWVDKNTAGVSMLTWLGFLAGSAFWLTYGIIHKEKPIIVANICFVIIQFFIVLGLFTN